VPVEPLEPLDNDTPARRCRVDSDKARAARCASSRTSEAAAQKTSSVTAAATSRGAAIQDPGTDDPSANDVLERNLLNGDPLQTDIDVRTVGFIYSIAYQF